MEHTKRILGCIADDFTGASDAASFLQKAGKRVLLLNGVPADGTDSYDCDAIVIALKNRTEPVTEAVAHSMEAVLWLEQHGITQYYFKYCSTFDSTPKGNIGPILDAALEHLNESYTVLCPALPVNGRTVEHGCLYVNGIPLHESHMKNHPLTPMWDCRIKNLMEAQSKYPCFELDSEALSDPELSSKLAEWSDMHEHFYIVPDYACWEDGEKIAKAFGGCRILSGGSGILEHLDKKVSHGIVLAGSCSVATLEQIRLYQQAGHPSFKIDPLAMQEGRMTENDILSFVHTHSDDYVLIYSSDEPDKVRKVQEFGREKIAEMLETAVSRTAVQLRDEGYRHFIVAGGETSGAVTKALGYNAFFVGKCIAPGVPLMTPAEDREVRLVLKSGNFGQPDFFERAIETVKENA